MKGSTQSSQTNYIAGLDSIRFICAIWVVLAHAGKPPITANIDKSTSLGWAIHGFYNNTVDGTAAVIVFFLISGICIHYPHRADNRIPSVWTFFLRRYVRICIPMVVAMAIAHYLLNFSLSVFEHSILWSLIAELFYYATYPAFLALRRQLSNWNALIIGSFALALAIAATNPLGGAYPVFGWHLNWLIGLPCWLMGCKLAEEIRSGQDSPVPDSREIWSWRLGIWIFSVFCSVARFHSPLGHPWTLNFFAIAVYFWLAKEIIHLERNRPLALFEWVADGAIQSIWPIVWRSSCSIWSGRLHLEAGSNGSH